MGHPNNFWHGIRDFFSQEEHFEIGKKNASEEFQVK